jgi:hypothetical protein
LNFNGLRFYIYIKLMIGKICLCKLDRENFERIQII